MKTWSNNSSVIILMALFLGAGCATGRVEQYYEGPKRPAREIARLVLPQEVDVLQVDGRERASNIFGILRSGYTMEFLAGHHQLTVRYSAIYDLNDEEHVAYYSEPVTLDFDFQGGTQYRLTYTIGREDFSSDLPTVEVDYKIEKDSGVIEESKKKEHRVISLMEPSPTTVLPAAVVPGQKAMNPPVPSSGVDVLPLLKHWWEQATPREKADFLEWAHP